MSFILSSLVCSVHHSIMLVWLLEFSYAYVKDFMFNQFSLCNMFENNFKVTGQVVEHSSCTHK
jgi:hypothetical protein